MPSEPLFQLLLALSFLTALLLGALLMAVILCLQAIRECRDAVNAQTALLADEMGWHDPLLPILTEIRDRLTEIRDRLPAPGARQNLGASEWPPEVREKVARMAGGLLGTAPRPCCIPGSSKPSAAESTSQN